jgi:hypothetical protein
MLLINSTAIIEPALIKQVEAFRKRRIAEM